LNIYEHKLGAHIAEKNTPRATIIEREEGHLGPYYDPENPWMVKIGQEQTMNYESKHCM
jgi:hypothetical protein